jgi:hypothetical protein
VFGGRLLCPFCGRFFLDARDEARVRARREALWRSASSSRGPRPADALMRASA